MILNTSVQESYALVHVLFLFITTFRASLKPNFVIIESVRDDVTQVR